VRKVLSGNPWSYERGLLGSKKPKARTIGQRRKCTHSIVNRVIAASYSKRALGEEFLPKKEMLLW
jgi:hypothetical protein